MYKVNLDKIRRDSFNPVLLGVHHIRELQKTPSAARHLEGLESLSPEIRPLVERPGHHAK